MKEAEYLTPEQVKSLLEAASGTRYGLLFEFLVNTGLRRGEALALKWRSHVMEGDGWLKIRGTLTREDGELVTTSTKTAKSRREVPITERTADILQQLRARQVAERDRAGSQWDETGYVFTTAFGEPCDPRNALRALKAAAEQAGPLGQARSDAHRYVRRAQKVCEIGVQPLPETAGGRLPARETASDLRFLRSG